MRQLAVCVKMSNEKEAILVWQTSGRLGAERGAAGQFLRQFCVNSRMIWESAGRSGFPSFSVDHPVGSVGSFSLG